MNLYPQHVIEPKPKRKPKYVRLEQKKKNRSERRKARLDPETQPNYGKYVGDYGWQFPA